MTNPWEDISLDDYESHMSLESVKQLQTMNSIMKDQFSDFPVETAMVLGIAGGNGLEYVSSEKFKKVYGVDVNKEYLQAVSKRYCNLSDILECIRVDLTKDYSKLPKSQMVIANLLIEYIGYQTFRNVILQVEPEYVSCVIQINTDDKNWVSDSPYLHAFDRLDEVHCQMDEQELKRVMETIGYHETLRKVYDLPNGKALIRMDFKQGKC
ncbi:MAG: methyltransferase type 11 [Lachnospiraceae bacterium]|nr:methyltransferase type 11 [Lachnospiraceae bacterium]